MKNFMKNFMEKHPVVSGLIIYSLAKGLISDVATAMKPNVTVIVVEPEDIPAVTPKKEEN